MARPLRMFEPDRLYLLINRTMQGRFLMCPSPQVNRLIGGLLAGFEADFVATCGGFVRSMFGERASEVVINEITTDMCGGPGEIGTALIREYVAYDLAAALQATHVPIRSINADKWPTNVTVNRKYADFDAVILDGYGHFLMQEAPEELNEALIEAVMNLGAGG